MPKITKTKLTRLGISFPPDLHKKFAAAADAAGMTQTTIVNRLVDAWCDGKIDTPAVPTPLRFRVPRAP